MISGESGVSLEISRSFGSGLMGILESASPFAVKVVKRILRYGAAKDHKKVPTVLVTLVS